VTAVNKSPLYQKHYYLFKIFKKSSNITTLLTPNYSTQVTHPLCAQSITTSTIFTSLLHQYRYTKHHRQLISLKCSSATCPLLAPHQKPQLPVITQISRQTQSYPLYSSHTYSSCSNYGVAHQKTCLLITHLQQTPSNAQLLHYISQYHLYINMNQHLPKSHHLFRYASHLLYFVHSILHTLYIETYLFFAVEGTSHNLYASHMARTKTTAPLSPKIPETQCSPNKSSRSKTSGSRKKHLTTKMDARAIQLVSHPTALDFSMDNNPDGPIAIRDYLDGSPMLLTPEERAKLAAEPIRSRRRRRLLEDNADSDSGGSQGGRPSHASVSLPSTYHDVSPDLHISLTQQHAHRLTHQQNSDQQL
jgi:hypothetical protein